MSCPHLEETSAWFDGAGGAVAHDCDECRAFLEDAAALRRSLRGMTFDAAPRRRFAPVLVPAALLLCVVLFLALRPERVEHEGAFAGLDGGGRAVIRVKP